jgi:glycine cleavage system H protein
VKRAILPCNGLDKQHGVIARELALRLAESDGVEIVCPVLLNNSPSRYEKLLSDSALTVVDGCPTRCASKLATKLGLRIEDKMLISDEAKNAGIELGQSLRPEPEGLRLIELILSGTHAQEPVVEAPGEPSGGFEPPVSFLTVTYDKYIFKIPAEGYLFNENDCWVRAVGNRARVGVSDYVQQNMTDITFFKPAEVGWEVEQFDEVGSLESGKSMMDVLSPVAGKVVAVNTQLTSALERVNEDPYGEGWIAEIELRGFSSDKELLLDAEAYAKLVEKKAAES